MAMLARHAMQFPEFRQVVWTISWNVGGTRSYAVHNINSFLFNYEGADGVKPLAVYPKAPAVPGVPGVPAVPLTPGAPPPPL